MVKTNYLWDEVSDNVIAEYEGGVASAVYTQESGLYGNLISQRRSGVSHFYHFDARGDTRNLTDASENVTDSRTYDAWGNVIAATGVTRVAFQYSGRIGCNAEDATVGGNYYARARYYYAHLARWGALDALHFIDGVNLYRYCRNSPVLFNDPSGTRTCEETCVIAQYAVNFRGGGSIVCDTGNPEGSCVCKFPLTIDDPGPPRRTVGTVPIGGCNNVFGSLAEFHERAHLTLGHVTCDGCPDGVSLAQIVPNLSLPQVECALRHRDILILHELMDKKEWRDKQSKSCLELIAAYIRSQTDWIAKNCGDISPDDLSKYDWWTLDDLARERKAPPQNPEQKGCLCDRSLVGSPVVLS